MRTRGFLKWSLLLIWSAVTLWTTFPTHAKKPKFDREELNLAKPPQHKFNDKRLALVYKAMLRQYKHIYSYAAADGLIFPNEKRELSFHLNLMIRIITIDKRNKKVTEIYRRLTRKQKGHTKKRRRRGRKRTTPKKLSADERSLLESAVQHKTRYEGMIRRFACRHIPSYPKKYKDHCKKSQAD